MSRVAEIGQDAASGFRVADCLPALGDILPVFVPAPAYADRVFRTGIPDAMKSRLIADAEAALGSSWPVLTAQAYRAFSSTGDRVGYESDYFERRRRVNALAPAEAVEGRGRFVDDRQGIDRTGARLSKSLEKSCHSPRMAPRDRQAAHSRFNPARGPHVRNPQPDRSFEHGRTVPCSNQRPPACRVFPEPYYVAGFEEPELEDYVPVVARRPS